MPEPAAPRVAVVQDGARLHYALPVALQRAGLLTLMVTDYYRGRGALPGRLAVNLVGRLRPALAARIAGRYHAELPAARVRAYPWLALRMLLARGRFDSDEAFFDWQSRRAAAWMLRHGLAPGRAGGTDAPNILMGFVRNLDPALCETCRERGMVVVADQLIAPRAIEQREEQIQAERWPGWQAAEAAGAAELTIQRERRTWEAACHITCASEYVRQGLIEQGVAAEKISVLPYPIDAGHYKVTERAGRAAPSVGAPASLVGPLAPLIVGCVGSVGLRKGAPYFMNVAKRFDPARVRFVMVGPVQLETQVAAEQGGAVELVGAVPRSEVARWLERFDVFFFPSTCEGSAGAVMEALAVGLPVVTSPNSGSVVRDGVEGFIRPYDDLDGYQQAIENLVANSGLRQQMSDAARRRAEAFNLNAYSVALSNLLKTLRK